MIVLTLLLVLLSLLYAFSKWRYSYWTSRGVVGPKPTPLLGNFFQSIIMKTHMGKIIDESYKKYKNDSYFGMFQLMKPSLVVCNPELIQTIFVKEFSSFHDNDFDIDEKADPLMATNPFMQKGEKWKISRSRITPCFTNVKIKSMLPLMMEVGDRMTQYLKTNVEATSEDGIDTKELCSKYTTDVVASCAFGINAESFTNPNSEFREMGRQIFATDIISTIKTFLALTMPWLTKFFSVSFIKPSAGKWFMGVIKDNVEYRETNNITRDDFLQSMMNLRAKSENSITTAEMTGYSFAFVTDGFETSSGALAFAMYEIAANPHVQDRLRSDIKDVLDKHEGKITYEALQELDFLDRIMLETLRKYPPLLFLMKRCTKDFAMPDQKDLIVEVGSSIIVPIYSIHRDPEHYPDPTRFDPDRFTEEAIQSRQKYTFLGFGEGPRICLGMKFAMAQTKAAIVAAVQNFSITVAPKTIEPIELDDKEFLTHAKGGLWLNFKELQSS